MQLTKKMTVRLLIAALCVAATQVAVWQVKYRTGLQAAQGATFDVTALPLQLGQWSGTSTEFDPRDFQEVGGFSVANHSYTNELGRHASVHLANFSTADLLIPHPPDLCYTGAGWTILNDDWQTDSHDRRYRLMLVERDGVRLCAAYWYQVGPDVAASREDLRKIMLKLRASGERWPPLIKVLIQVPVDSTEDDARSTVQELGFPIYDWVRTHS